MCVISVDELHQLNRDAIVCILKKKGGNMACPSCGRSGQMYYKCDVCGEPRCSNTKCSGSGTKVGSAVIRGKCKACGKGKYQKL